MLSCQKYAIKYYTIYALLANPENKLQEDWTAVKLISITFQQQYYPNEPSSAYSSINVFTGCSIEVQSATVISPLYYLNK